MPDQLKTEFAISRQQIARGSVGPAGRDPNPISLEAQLTALGCCVMLEHGGGVRTDRAVNASFSVEAAINPQAAGAGHKHLCCSASLWHLINGHHHRASEPRLYICLQGMMQVFMKLMSPRFLIS